MLEVHVHVVMYMYMYMTTCTCTRTRTCTCTCTCTCQVVECPTTPVSSSLCFPYPLWNFSYNSWKVVGLRLVGVLGRIIALFIRIRRASLTRLRLTDSAQSFFRAAVARLCRLLMSSSVPSRDPSFVVFLHCSEIRSAWRSMIVNSVFDTWTSRYQDLRVSVMTTGRQSCRYCMDVLRKSTLSAYSVSVGIENLTGSFSRTLLRAASRYTVKRTCESVVTDPIL